MDSWRKYRVVLLNSPCERWSLKATQELFSALVDLKLKGYGAEYGQGVLPVDTTDFIAAHQLVCLEKGKHLHPVMGYKSTLLAQCLNYNMIFPGLALVKAAKASPHDEVIQGIMDRCQKEGRGLAYTGSWTVDPQARENKELARWLREVFLTLYVAYHQDYGIQEIIAGGTIRFKTEKLIKEIGHEPITYRSEILPPISVAHLLNEKVVVTHLTQFTEKALEYRARHEKLWVDRIIIDDSKELGKILPLKKAA